MLDRKDSVITTEQDKIKEEKHLERVLKENGYKNWTINMAKRQQAETETKKKEKPNKKKQNKGEKKNKLIVIPYIHGLSEQLAKVNKKFNITTCMKPHMTL